MPSRRQSSIRIPPAAGLALGACCNLAGLSRDACVRDLLDRHLHNQLARGPADRLTHISTVLRFPERPLGRRTPDGLERLAIRLEPWMGEAAIATSLRLPGQSARRGHHDYARRPLTDAFLTALAKTHPFTIDGLEGLPETITQGAAVGLWRLTVAATLTPAEKLAMWSNTGQAGSGGDQAAILKRLLHEGNFSWHDPKRFRVAHHLARKLLSGNAAASNLEMLQAQNVEFQQLLEDLEAHSFETPESSLLADAPGVGRSVEGRGGSVVWRARRSLARQSIREWLGSATDSALLVDPPGWSLRMPENWHGIASGLGASPPTQVREDIYHRRVVEVRSPDGQAIAWPYICDRPVPGYGAFLDSLPALKPTEIVELTLAVDERLDLLFLPIITAIALGFISKAEGDHKVELARAKNKRAIEGALERARADLDDVEFARLSATASEPDTFAQRCHHLGITITVSHPYWTWHTSSIELELATPMPDRLAVLGSTRASIYKRLLEREMELAARRAFSFGQPPVGDFEFDGTEFGLP